MENERKIVSEKVEKHLKALPNIFIMSLKGIHRKKGVFFLYYKGIFYSGIYQLQKYVFTAILKKIRYLLTVRVTKDLLWNVQIILYPTN